jgi:hypothetical protein
MKNKKLLIVKALVGVLVLMFLVLIGSCATSGNPVSSDWPDMRINHDEFQNISFVQSTKLNGLGSWVPMELYIGISEDIKILRLKIVYRGRNWIFFEKVTLVNDQGSNVQYTFNRSDINRNVLSGAGIQETADVVLSVFNEGSEFSDISTETKELIEILQIGKHSNEQKIKELKELVNGTNIRLRFTGDKYQDVKIHDTYLAGLRNVIAYYESITAKIE